MLKFLREYFSFNRGERNGTMALSVIMIMVYLFPYIYDELMAPRAYPADPDFISAVEKFYNLSQNKPDQAMPVRFDSTLGSPVPGVSVTRIKTDINSADTSSLMRIRGIGPVFSRRIVGYRSILGGYFSVDQLLEVYGMDDKKFAETKPFVYADTTLIVRLRPIDEQFGDLLRHPYLEYDQVSEIFRLRNKGLLETIDDLKQSPLFSEGDLKRLAPYFKFD